MDNQPIEIIQPNSASFNTSRANKQKLIWGIICLSAPTALFVLSFVILLLNGWVVDASSPLHVILNILVFMIGATVVLTWLPGVIIGIVLISTRKK